MNPSDACYALIKEFERGPNGLFAAEPYLCPAGKETVGWGHVLQPRDRLTYPLTREQADDLLIADVEKFAAAVATGVRVHLTQSMFDALVSFAFNVGLGAFLGSTLRHHLNVGAYDSAADQFRRWVKATDPKTKRKVVLAGLVRRREMERTLFLRDGVPT